MLIGIDASRANRKFKGGTEWYSYYLIRELAKIDSTNPEISQLDTIAEEYGMLVYVANIPGIVEIIQ